MAPKTTKVAIFARECLSCKCEFNFTWNDTWDNDGTRLVNCPECGRALPATKDVVVVTRKPVERALAPSSPETTKDPY